MKFGIFYEMQLPRPWGVDDERQLYQNALDQVELADRLGYNYAWEVEHHFLEEYSTRHSRKSSSRPRASARRISVSAMALSNSPRITPPASRKRLPASTS
jgi:alkanesulfonate monooxygenase SsuD/methylene tetrahydromethanopterin reductase-like flavin-dependent oxidoreductase (luciferase family)